MGTIATLAVALTLGAEAYHKGLEAAASEAESKSQSITQSLSNIGKGIVFGAGALVAGGLAEIGVQLKDSIVEAENMQNVQTQLNSVLANTGSVTGVTAAQVEGLAEKYSGLTKFSDDNIVSAGAVLARFKEIGKDTFPAANMAAMNLATTMGTDLPSAAQLLGKILEQPGTAMMRLRAAGVEVTPELDKMLKKMAATGDTAGAQKVILDALNQSIGGVALAAGETASGGMAILENKMAKIHEQIGMALIPIISDLTKMFTNWLGSPAIQDGITFLSDAIKTFADAFMGDFSSSGDILEALANGFLSLYQVSPVFQFIGDSIFTVMDIFQRVVSAFQNDQGLVVAVLAVIGVAIATFAITTAASMVPVIIGMLPLIAVMALIGAAAYLLYHAWQTNWGGIHEKTAEVVAWLQTAFENVKQWLAVNIPIAIQTLKTFWENVLLPAIQNVWNWVQTVAFPIIQKLWDWLQINIPIAIQTLKTFWEQTLLPAIQKVWNWVQTVAFPIIQNLWNWLQINVPAAIKTLTDYWNNTLLPAITTVWNYFNDHILPILQSVADIMNIALTLALNALAGLWQNVLQPALKTVWDYINTNVMPIFKSIHDYIVDDLGPKIQWLVDKVLTPLADAINGGIKKALDWFYSKLQDIKTMLASIKLPDWLTPGSPTPFELGLVGIGNALAALNNTSLPQFKANLSFEGAGLPAMAAVTASSGISSSSNAQTVNIYPQPQVYKQGELTMNEELDLYKWRYRF
jgi:hypothetical protein